jgi:hypothetical protein
VDNVGSSTDGALTGFSLPSAAIVVGMTAIKRPTIRVSDPSELLEAIPYLIGFHPRESLVLIGFRHDPETSYRRQIGVSVRVDLPPTTPSQSDLLPLAAALRRAGIESCIAAVLTSDVGPAPTEDLRWDVLAQTLAQSLDDEDILLEDVLLANDTHWWSMQCSNDLCCPPEGTQRAVGCSVTAAEATVAGLVALPDREAVERMVDPLPDEDRLRLHGVLAAAVQRVSDAAHADRLRRVRRTDENALFAEIELWSDRGRQSRSLSDRRLARFGVALSDVAIRDSLWLAIDEGRCDATDFLRELLRRLPSPYDAPALFLFGWSQWRLGNGTLAAIAAERALASNPDYSAARLLQEAVLNGIDPRSFPTLVLPDAAAEVLPDQR